MRIMIVDDEPIGLMALKFLLESVGLESDPFATVPSALEAFGANPGRYDAIVTDLAMPVMRGTDLARVIRESRPGFPVAILTGMPDFDATREGSRGSRAFDVLSKPAELGQILDTLRAQGLDVPVAGIAA